MNFEILISTMHKDTSQLSEMLASMNISCDAVVIVQGDFEGTDELKLESGRAKIIYTKERGLSKSRNMGLENCSAKYAYIMDDDVVVNTNAISDLVDRMETDGIDLATCKHKCQSGNYPKKYANKEFFHTVLSAAKVASIEICVKVQSIKKASIRFDERFGLGTNLPSGEEYIFVTDCIKSGFKAKYYPISTGVHPDEASGTDFYSSFNKVLAKREMFKRIFGKKAPLFIVAFWVKKLPIAIKAGYFLSFSKALLLETNN